MEARRIGSFTATLLACAALLAQAIGESAPAQAPQGFDLRRLTPLLEGRMSDVEAAQLYLTFLQEETSHPSPPRRGLGGGWIAHEYILAQIVLADRGASVSRDVLWRAATAAPTGEYRDAIVLLLGSLGDWRVPSFLIGYLGNPNNPSRLRERAARALAENPQPGAVPVLAAALRDPFWERAGQPTQPVKHYSIRSMARRALLRIKESGIPLPADVQRAVDTVVTSEPLPRDPPPPAKRK